MTDTTPMDGAITDPDRTLAEALTLARRIEDAPDPAGAHGVAYADQARRLAHLVRWLNRHAASGGALPTPWAKDMTAHDDRPVTNVPLPGEAPAVSYADPALAAAHLVTGHRNELINALAIAWGASLHDSSSTAIRDCPDCDGDPEAGGRMCDQHNAARTAAANFAHLEQALRALPEGKVPGVYVTRASLAVVLDDIALDWGLDLPLSGQMADWLLTRLRENR
jgi:hypothetical protein